MTCRSAGPASVPVFTLVYVSTARRLAGPAEMGELLRASRERNARSGITGALLYSDGTFIQALEGEETAVRALYARIAQDPRHVDPIVIMEEAGLSRQFGPWEMSYGGLGADLVTGYTAWSAATGPVSGGTGGRARLLVQGFGRAHAAGSHHGS